MKKFYLILSSLLWIFPAVWGMSLPFQSTTDYSTAVQQAQKEEKAVLLLFVMKSCGHCQALKEKVLSAESFRDFAEQSLITVAYDYEERAALPEAHKTQMLKLLKRHGVGGFPAILLLNAKEEVLLKSEGYGGSSAETVIRLFQERISSKKTELETRN